mmetsp:Transcript_10553/g.25616  ORF Transcript_10553/g.25616 Transcript_10553/m.25616 type:complete len:208 (-) Transcript_10553:314-937(-)
MDAHSMTPESARTRLEHHKSGTHRHSHRRTSPFHAVIASKTSKHQRIDRRCHMGKHWPTSNKHTGACIRTGVFTAQGEEARRKKEGHTMSTQSPALRCEGDVSSPHQQADLRRLRHSHHPVCRLEPRHLLLVHRLAPLLAPNHIVAPFQQTRHREHVAVEQRDRQSTHQRQIQSSPVVRIVAGQHSPRLEHGLDSRQRGLHPPVASE